MSLRGRTALLSHASSPHRDKREAARRQTAVKEYLGSEGLPGWGNLVGGGTTMDILLGSGRFLARRPPLALVPRCSKGSPDKGGRDKGDASTDWDKAWTTFKNKGKRTLFSDFSPDKYVSWNPRRSEYPLSEEVDPIKRTERSNLMLWTSPEFTLVGAIIIILTLLIYTLIVPAK